MQLDRDQLAVVNHASGPLCVFGGPGTGKTTVLEERFIRLSLEDGCAPDRILFLVPNRAQKIALQDRLTQRLLLDARLKGLIEVPVYTWHGLAHHLVSRHYDRLAYPEPPVLLTSPEQWGDIRDALAAEADLDWPHHSHLLRNRGFVDEVVDFCIRARQRLLEAEELDRLADARPGWAEIVRFAKAQRARLHARARVDYPTLLADAVELIANHDDVRTALQRRFSHVLVDDGQELALVQQRLLRFVAGSGADQRSTARSLVIAADPDSAIETFRGAEPEWLTSLGDELGEHDSVTLAASYRLGPELGGRAVEFVSAVSRDGDRPTVFSGASDLEIRTFSNLSAEVDSIARTLRMAHLRDGIAYDDMAILVTSTRSLVGPLERALDALDVPYSVMAPDRPLERELAVRAFVNLARLAYAGEPDEEALIELLRSPLTGLEDAQVRELERFARATGRTLLEALNELPDGYDADAAAKVAHVMELRALMKAKKDAPADEAFWAIWERSGYCRDLVAHARKSLADPANRDLDALVALARALARFVERRHGSGTLAQYLDAIGRADFGADPWLPPWRAAGGVQVLSFHAAKGRQWSVVAVAGCVEGAIPKGRRARGLFDPYFLDTASAVERVRRNEAEDRRVFYVALTRATKLCLVTASPGPTRKGQPSRFVQELSKEPLELHAPQDLPPLTFAEAAARHRRVLADASASRPARLAALQSIGRIAELDAHCAAARPHEWWWRWDWTEGDVSIRQQQGDRHSDLPLDKLSTSYSRISHYDNCGLAYLCSTVLGLDPDSSHNMAFGSWIHQIFEEWESGRFSSYEDVFARYDELFDERVFPNRAIARQFRNDGRIMLERYGRYLRPGRAALVEKDFSVDFDGHRITGRIDRVDVIGRDVVVTDYKTSRYTAAWSEAKESLQLAIYWLAARSDDEIKTLGDPISMQLVYPGAPLSKGEVAKRCQEPDQAVKALERLPQLIGGVLEEDFRPSPEADCQWCKFKPLCPLWSEGEEVPS